jgi:hypothetical protein
MRSAHDGAPGEDGAGERPGMLGDDLILDGRAGEVEEEQALAPFGVSAEPGLGNLDLQDGIVHLLVPGQKQASNLEVYRIIY